EDKRYLAGRSKGPKAQPIAEEAPPELAADPAQADEMEAGIQENDQIAQAQGPAGEDAEGGLEDYPAARPQLSALELFNRGKQALRNGEKEAALRYYTQAYQTGEKLDRRKEQEIQEFLAQNQARARKIQLLTRQVPESDFAEGGADDAPRPIDQV